MFRKLLQKKRGTRGGRPSRQVSEPRGLSSAKIVLTAFVPAALAVAGAGFVVQQQLDGYRADQQAAFAAAEVRGKAAQLAGRIQGYADVLERAAAQLGSGGESDLRVPPERLTELFPGALRVRLVSPQQVEPDASVPPALGYACLDLVRQAEARGTPPAEVHVFGTPEAHLDLARPVRAPGGNGAVTGTLLLSMDAKVVQGWLASLAGGGGYLELRQGRGDEFLVLAGKGNKGLAQGRAPYVADVPGSAWHLTYWPPLVAAGGTAGAVWMTAAVVIAALALVFLVLAITLGRVIHGDLVKLVQHCIALRNRKRDHGFTVRLAEFKKAVLALDQLLGGTVPAETATKAPSSPKVKASGVPAAEEQGLSSLMFMNEDAMSVEEMPPQGEDETKDEQ